MRCGRGYLLFLLEIRKTAKPEVELLFTFVPVENSYNVKYLENGGIYDDGSMEAEYKTAPGLSIGTMNVEAG